MARCSTCRVNFALDTKSLAVFSEAIYGLFMVKLIAPRFALGFALLGIGFAFAGPMEASAHPHPERVEVISGTVAVKPDRERRTRIEVFQNAGEVTIIRRVHLQNGERELRGGRQDRAINAAPRTVTGRTPETVVNGVRVINLPRNLREK